jgi:cell division protein FtsL
LDIENALRQYHVEGHLDEIDKKILKLETQMNDIKEVVKALAEAKL